MRILAAIVRFLFRVLYRMLRFFWAWCVALVSLFFFLRFLARRWLEMPAQNQNHTFIGPLVTWLCELITAPAATEFMTHFAFILGAIFIGYWFLKVLLQERTHPGASSPL